MYQNWCQNDTDDRMNNKDFKTVILTIVRMFKKLQNRLKMLSRDIEDPNQISRDKNYNNCVEKYTRWPLQQIRHFRRKY